MNEQRANEQGANHWSPQGCKSALKLWGWDCFLRVSNGQDQKEAGPAQGARSSPGEQVSVERGTRHRALTLGTRGGAWGQVPSVVRARGGKVMASRQR